MPCTENDYSVSYSDCENGKRNVTYSWNEQLFCTIDNSILPKDKTESCEGCNPGQSLELNSNNKQSCVYCKAGL